MRVSSSVAQDPVKDSPGTKNPGNRIPDFLMNAQFSCLTATYITNRAKQMEWFRQETVINDVAFKQNQIYKIWLSFCSLEHEIGKISYIILEWTNTMEYF